MPPEPMVSFWYACSLSKPDLTTMLPGMELGSGNCILRLGATSLLARAGDMPFVCLSVTFLKPRMIVPRGLPPSRTCSCPESSVTTISPNCISSLGISKTFCMLSGNLDASWGWFNSCACSTGSMALLVVSNVNLTLPYIFSPMV